MPSGLYDPERRYRRRFWVSIAKLVVFLASIMGVGAFAYQMGIERMKGQEIQLGDRIGELEKEKTTAERRLLQLATLARDAETRAKEAEARYAAEVPTGDVARLANLVRERLDEGIDAERLAFVIAAVGNARDCESPETKRFIVTTPIYRERGRNTSVAFADGAITITGEGTSAMDPDGRPESWYDPAQPVTLTFVHIDGSQSTATGNLPLQHSVVVGATEYRFNATAGARSFLEVTADRCAFP